MAGPDAKTPDGVILTNNIHENGRKKLLIIGKTGTGKSSLCNVITGHPHDSKIFPVSAEAVSCTQSTQFANVFFNNDKGRPVSLIDTIGFDDPHNDTDAKVIGELVHELKNNCDHVNLFMIAVNGQNPRLDGALLGMIRIFEGMFGEEFWNQAVIVFTRLQMDKKTKKRRENNAKQTDEDLAGKYLELVQAEFPKGQGLQYLFMDACYEEEDTSEQEAFDGAMEKLWKSLDRSPPLPTTKVQVVETESKKLKNTILEKEKERQLISEKFEAKEREWKQETDRLEKQRESDRRQAAEEQAKFRNEMEKEQQKINNLRTEMIQKQAEDKKKFEEQQAKDKEMYEQQQAKIKAELNAEMRENEERLLAIMKKEAKEREYKMQEEKNASDRAIQEKERKHQEERRKLQEESAKKEQESAKREQQHQNEKAAQERKQQEELEELQKEPGFFSRFGRGVAAGLTGLGKKFFGSGPARSDHVESMSMREHV